jgi:hypothetical protein
LTPPTSPPRSFENKNDDDNVKCLLYYELYNSQHFRNRLTFDNMASGRSLGLGSRANQTKTAATTGSLFRQTATNTATLVKTTTTTTTTKKRRGFGLFDSEYESEAEFVQAQKKEPVRFTGNKSGFVSDSDGSSSLTPSVVKSSSRKSKLTTPSRKKITNRRGTPYHKNTTGRALFRYNRGQESENDEDRMIGESMFTAPAKTNGAAKPKKRARFATMSGALEEDDQECESTEPDTDRERSLSPVKKSPRQRAADETNQQSQTGVARKTWGQWLKSIIADPVSTLLAAPSRSPAEQMNKLQIEEAPETPGPELSVIPPMPGSFEKPTVALAPPSPPSAADDVYSGRNFLGHNTQETPVRTSERLFQYSGTPFNFVSPASTGSNASQSPVSVKKGSRTATAPTSAKRLAPPPVTSFRKPSNFIARMRGVTKDRYRPYGRPSASPMKHGSIEATRLEKLPKNLPPNEVLEILEQRERDRKVQEAEDRYIKRETLKKAGLPFEDSEMSGTDEEPVRKDKGKGKAATVEDMDEEEEDRSSTNTPPGSPPPKTNNLFQDMSPSKAPLFQFKPIAPKPPTSPEKKPADRNIADKPAFSFGAPPLFGAEQEDHDKENISAQPPPSPAMSHRELPAPAAPAFPPPPSSTSLFGDKPQPIGGFGIAEPPQFQPPASPSTTRQRFDKFKPRISSGLRESATIEKENEQQDKENPTENGGEGSSSKPGKMAFGTSTTEAVQQKATGALREVGRNAAVGTGVKVDVRAKIAAVGHLLPDIADIGADEMRQLPVKDLSPIVAWPAVEVFTLGDPKMQEAVRKAWNAEELSWLQEWSGAVFGEARQQVARV